MRWLPAGVVMLLLQGAMWLAPAQSTRPEDLGAGKLLVASRDLADPNFSKTVVLLVQYDDDGVVGLIVNRRSKVPISRVLEEVVGAKGRSDPVYSGGPVGRTDVLALLRSRRPPGDATRVFGDVFLVSTKELMEQTFSSAIEPDKVRVYLGYAGWTGPQLEHELELGAWYIFPGTAAAVYDSDPDSLWPRMIRDTEMRIASTASARAFR